MMSPSSVETVLVDSPTSVMSEFSYACGNPYSIGFVESDDVILLSQ